MARYMFSVDGVALAAATAKTILELGTAASDRARIKEWWVEFDGASSTAVPVKVEIGRFTATTTTMTTGTAKKLDPSDGTPSVTVRHTSTSEGAGTIEAGAAVHRIHPQGGLFYQAPDGGEEVLAVSTFWRIRVTAAAIVNVTVGVVWDE